MAGFMHKLKENLRFCFPIAVIIFVVAVLSDFCVRFIYQKDIVTGFFVGLFEILIVTLLLTYFVWDSPKMKKMLGTMFGLTDENEKAQGLDNEKS